jgi:uncharacterized membrane protein (UPF0127 family)
MAAAYIEDKASELAAEVSVARGLWSRFWGLMGRRSLPDGHGLLLEPCSSVHMFFMRFPLDVVFLNREKRVVRIIPALKPWRTALGGRGAHSALELNAGAAEAAQLEVGDVVLFADS